MKQSPSRAPKPTRGICRAILIALVASSWLLGLPAGAQDQTRPHPLTMPAPPEPLLIDARPGLRALAHSADGTLVVGGQLQERFGECGPRSRAFLARRDPYGHDLWFRGSDLLTELTSLDAGYILASTVRDVTVDPFTHEVFAIVEALLGWRGAACPGVATTRGTLVLRLAADGALLHDAYLGTRPEGRIVSSLGCSELCSPERSEQLLGSRITVDPNGSVTVTGHKLSPTAAIARGALGSSSFAARLSPDLSLRPAFALDSAPLRKSGVACAVGSDDVVSVSPVNGTMIGSGNPRFLAASDDCKIKVEPLDGVDSYGIEVELQVPSPIPNPYIIELDAQYLGDVATQVKLSVRRAVAPLASDPDVLETWLTDPSGRLQKTVNLTALIASDGGDISDYIQAGNRLEYQLEGRLVHTMGGNCEEAFEYDRGGG
ncbi:MAG: hypothetical protein AAF560_23730 [Acidobacteriota bacterium]